MDETKRLTVTFTVQVDVPAESHPDWGLAQGHKHLMTAFDNCTPDVSGAVMAADGTYSAIYNPAEVVEVLDLNNPQPGDTVRLWLEDASVRGTLYKDEAGIERVALLPPGVDPLNAHQDFTAYRVIVNKHRRRMELVERQA